MNVISFCTQNVGYFIFRKKPVFMASLKPIVCPLFVEQLMNNYFVFSFLAATIKIILKMPELTSLYISFIITYSSHSISKSQAGYD